MNILTCNKPTMPSVQCFRKFFNERLTAAAEEIFTVFEKTIVEYEEEIKRQRKLLDVFLKPEVNIHRIELPQRHVCKDEDVLCDQRLYNQERSSSVNQEDPEPPQIKEEEDEEEVCTSRDRQELVLKEEPDIVMLTYGEDDHSGGQNLSLSNDGDQCVDSMTVKISEVPESNTDRQLHPHSSESQDPRGVEREDSDKQKETHHTNNIHSYSVLNSTISTVPCDTDTGKKSFKCDTCEKVFPSESRLMGHQRSHTGVRPYTCDVCCKRFTQKSILNVHKRIHTGEKPHSCNICGKRFGNRSLLKCHKRIHTGEKPFSCIICGYRFRATSTLKRHLKRHTGEKPYLCNTCGKRFRVMSNLKRHIIVHTDEKPYSCKTCGRAFRSSGYLSIHMRTHTGKKPYQCDTCGKAYFVASSLVRHTRSHTGE